MKIKDSIIVYAFRYALGRQTHAVIDVAKYITEHMDELHINAKEKILEEIKEADDLGDPNIDEPIWIDLAGIISEYIARRN